MNQALSLTKVAGVACVDPRALARFFAAVGFARALQEHTHLVWEEDGDPSFFNWYLEYFGKGRPGWVLVNQDHNLARKKANGYAAQYQDAFYAKIGRDPGSAGKYLAALDKIREDSLEFMRQRFAEAHSINREIRGEVRDSLALLHSIKISAGLITAFSPTAIIPVAAQVTTFIVNDWGKLDKASLICADWITGKGADAIADRSLERAEASLSAGARKKIAELNADIARKKSSQKVAKRTRALMKEMGKANAAAQPFRAQALAAKIVGKTVLPLLFAIPDLIEMNEDLAD